jgi:HK97 family phage major capsid protein
MRTPTTPDPVAPSDDAEQPLTSPERRDEPVEPIAAPTPQEITPVSDKYLSREDKASRVNELEAAIKRTATEYPGVLPADVQASYDADKDELRTLRKDIDAWDARQADIAGFARDEERREPSFVAPTVIRTKPIEDIYDVVAVEQLPVEKRRQTLRDNAMRSIETSILPKHADVDALAAFIEYRDGGEEEEQEATRRILLTGSPAYKRAFAKYLRYGNERAWTPEESRAAALAVTGTTTTGGYMVPYILDPTFINIGAHTSINPYRAACRVETISGGNNWRAVTATAITAKWDAEAAASVEGGPTIGQPTFTVQRADAFATVSIETLQDRPDVTGELSALFAEAKDTLEENSFTLGTGATVYPFGMFRTLAFTNKDTATDNVTAIADMLALEGDLPLRHRMNAAFFMSRSTQRQLEALDTTGYYFKRPGQYFAAGSAVLQSSPTGNTGTQLLGYPVWEVPSAVSTLTSDGAIIVVFGDPKNYVIVDRIGMNVEVVPTMLDGATPSFPTGQRGIYCYWRGTARPLNVDGMRSLSVQ